MKHLKIAALAALMTAVPAQAQDLSPLQQGFYVAPMVSYLLTDNDRQLDDGPGGTLAAGYRFPGLAVELAGVYADLDRKVDGGGSGRMSGGNVSALGFPFDGLPGFFLLFGAGYLDTNHQAISGGAYEGATFEGGLGYLFPLSFGDYEFAVRTEARYRHNQNEDDPPNNTPAPDEVDRSGLEDAVFNLGLHLPLGRRVPPPPPPVEPVAVVPVVTICSDGQDNDIDGQIDFPADPGCSAADDGDENDPAQCADGKDNDGDGLADFPADKGCAAADDNDEVDPCKTPEPGERISLKGCGLGDVIVLRGVNFEFDKARLTANARTILDNVAEELSAYPELEVELSGHTDAKGTDEYNQHLSDRRAAAVKSYLVGKGIAGSRMSTVGSGESQPVADNETDEGRELNRRTELKVTKGVAPGGPAVQTEAAAPAG